MKFNFAETFRRLRKESGLTQEKMSEILGVSSQSVSRWELDNGYPDIELLPAIANCFGVTIDCLLSNDTRSKEEDRRIFQETVNTLSTETTEQIDFIKKYCLKYPNEDAYAYDLICAIMVHAIGSEEKRKKFMPLLRKNVERLLETNLCNLAIRVMAAMCEENDLEKWLNRAPYGNFGRRDCLLWRARQHQDWETANIQRGLSLFEQLAKRLNEPGPDALGAQEKERLHREILKTAEAFGKEKAPAAWGAFCAYKRFVLAATLFGQGKMEEGWKFFDEAAMEYKIYFSAKEEWLPIGGALFANLKVNRAWTQAIDGNGKKHALFCSTAICKPERSLELLTNPKWSWFDAVRDTEKYKEVIAWMQKIAHAD